MRLLVVIFVAMAAACAHDRASEAPSGPLVPAQLISCAVEPPPAVSAAAPTGDVSADFQVDTRGKVRDVHVQGAKGAYAKALRRHLESCEYSPATRGGRPVATRRAVLYGAYR
jgi:hypothetical protein